MTAPARTAARPRSRTRAVVYFVLAVAGLVGTWYFNIRYSSQGGGNYLGDWFANAAASSAAVDILVVFAVTIVFYFDEVRRLRGRLWMVVPLVVLSAALAVAFVFPLFLGLRELRLRRIEAGEHHVTTGAR